MARIFNASFESRNLTYEMLSVVGSPTVSNDIYFKGVASARFNATGSEVSSKTFADLGSATDMIHRAMLYFVSRPGSTTPVIQLTDAGGNNTSIRVTSTGTLQLWDDVSSTQSGADSSVLNLNTWYRVEIACGTTHAGNDVQAQLNGVEFANRATAQNGADHRSWKVGVMGSVTCELYIDELASNDTTGSTNTLFPGEAFTLSKTLINKLRPAVFTPGIAK